MIIVALLILGLCAFGLGVLSTWRPRAAALGALALLVLGPAVVGMLLGGAS